jgi:hypothetical protein
MLLLPSASVDGQPSQTESASHDDQSPDQSATDGALGLRPFEIRAGATTLFSAPKKGNVAAKAATFPK